MPKNGYFEIEERFYVFLKTTLIQWDHRESDVTIEQFLNEMCPILADLANQEFDIVTDYNRHNKHKKYVPPHER